MLRNQQHFITVTFKTFPTCCYTISINLYQLKSTVNLYYHSERLYSSQVLIQMHLNLAVLLEMHRGENPCRRFFFHYDCGSFLRSLSLSVKGLLSIYLPSTTTISVARPNLRIFIVLRTQLMYKLTGMHKQDIKVI